MSQFKLEQLCQSQGHEDRVWSINWSAKGELASCSGDGAVMIWDENEGKLTLKQTIEIHNKTVRCVAWSHDGNTLASSSFDKSISIHSRNTSGEFDTITELEVCFHFTLLIFKKKVLREKGLGSRAHILYKKIHLSLDTKFFFKKRKFDGEGRGGEKRSSSLTQPVTHAI